MSWQFGIITARKNLFFKGGQKKKEGKIQV